MNLTDLENKIPFPAIRGIQAKREYYLVMCSLRDITRFFCFDEKSEVPAEMRAQRVLNRSRVPEIARYIVENNDNYCLSAITASVDGDTEFIPAPGGGNRKIGTLIVPMEARFIVNDGQHRRAALQLALEECPELAHETIAVVLFIDAGLKRSQQMFADLNKHAVRPTRSLGILYDQRDPMAGMVRNLVQSVPVFNGWTELEKTTISNRSTKIFTLSNIYQATQMLLRKKKKDPIFEEDETLAYEFWTEMTENIPEWQHIADGDVVAVTVRENYLHVHGVVLKAMGTAGADLLKHYPNDWKTRLKRLRKINWSRRNKVLWEGRAMELGKIRRSQDNIKLTTNVLKKRLGLTLNDEEAILEADFEKPNRNRK